MAIVHTCPNGLYDDFVSIAVPSDKARAVVDAMEHDMATTLATIPDLENLRLASKQDLELLRRDMESGFALLDLSGLGSGVVGIFRNTDRL